jgi:hypothetical protein
MLFSHSEVDALDGDREPSLKIPRKAAQVKATKAATEIELR